MPLDRVLYRQCKKFENLSANQRVAVRRSISEPMEDTLWEFARRSSVFALRDDDPDRVRAGLVAMSMLPSQHDYRDVYMTLGLLRRAGSELGLTIEINPTSNLLIGNLGDLTNHPLWRMRSPRNDGQKKLRLCIGSDDPTTFATSLIEEYQLLHDAIVLAGLGADEADSWIEHVRQSGLESRFTLPRMESVPGKFEPASVGLGVGIAENF